jgi:hypothetical protein
MKVKFGQSSSHGLIVSLPCFAGKLGFLVGRVGTWFRLIRYSKGIQFRLGDGSGLYVHVVGK